MKLPRWLITVLSIAVIVGAMLIASRFSEKSLVYAGGSISIAPEAEAGASGHRNLFIVVYDQDNPAPMPYGALRVELKEAPKGTFYHFVLTKENLSVMAGKQAHHELKTLRIKAKVTAASFVGEESPGDVSGEVSDIALGDETVAIVVK
jgi:hypothetical protein